MISVAQAVKSLIPSAEFSVVGDTYSGIQWLSSDQQIPTEAEITAEVARLQSEYEATEYQRQRAAEYPPMADYLDAVVKGDQAQIDKYISDCLAVKAKYPKPTVE